ncbi:DUF4817 domain-containing protein [Trichonephila clavipes]|nr:DUF4817 domain-containing protein [Trichonephila clavipes]
MKIVMEYWVANMETLRSTALTSYEPPTYINVSLSQNTSLLDIYIRLSERVFSDEAHFWLNGYVNKQNCRIWSEANPQVYVETPLHPEQLTVWCALWAGGIIGLYFFKTMKATTLQSMLIGIEP